MHVHAESRGMHSVRQVINDKNGPWTQECQFPEHASAQSPQWTFQLDLVLKVVRSEDSLMKSILFKYEFYHTLDVLR